MRARGASFLGLLGVNLIACGPRPVPVAMPVPSPTPPLLRIDVDPAGPTPVPETVSSGDVLGFRSYSLVPGLAAEVDFAMKRGAAVTAEFRANGPLVMDSHHHPTRDETVIYGTAHGHAGRLHFTAPFDGVFSFLWAPASASSEPVDVYLVLRGDAEVVKWIVGAPTSPTGMPDAALPEVDLDL